MDEKSRHYLLVLIVSFVLVLSIGWVGFRYIIRDSWIRSFYYASTLGLIIDPKSLVTGDQLLFASFYFLLAGFVFVAVAGAVISNMIGTV